MKYIGLDLGSVTCGISRSETGRIAQPVKTIRFHPDDYDEAIDKILELLKEEKPGLVDRFIVVIRMKADRLYRLGDPAGLRS